MKKLFDFYIHSSIHVGLAITALAFVTYYFFEIPINVWVIAFVFFSSVVGYNYTKYTTILLKKDLNTEYKTIQLLTFLSVLIAGFCFFKLSFVSQITIMITGLLTSLYALSVFNHKNIRSISGIKIYIVALCWVGITLLLPLFEADYPINSDVIVKCFQRFLLVIILILIFEIIDLKEDSPSLKTVPQTIGVRNTKILGILLLILFFYLEFSLSEYKISQLLINGILAVSVLLFTLFANEKKSKYYTTFWVESIPILWLVLIVLFR